MYDGHLIWFKDEEGLGRFVHLIKVNVPVNFKIIVLNVLNLRFGF
jgi:hypothetical protein